MFAKISKYYKTLIFNVKYLNSLKYYSNSCYLLSTGQYSEETYCY